MNSSIDPVSFIFVFGALALLPMIMICTTSFLKISVVLLIVRNAMGVQQVPPSIAIYSIAMAVTMLVMAPVFKQVSDALPKPGAEQEITRPADKPGTPSLLGMNFAELKTAVEPMRKFMLKNTPPQQLTRFHALVVKQWEGQPELARDLSTSDYVVLVPAFVVAELELAFQIGFMLYIPFVVIDLLISNLLLALGMQMVSPMMISLPLKILLFVILNGWTRLVEGLAQSYL